ncbi:MAG: DUF1016 N-terminal domain-containing protein [Pirellula sp.]|jgi:predicted nuclease of restriction endonuclease-like (RecB) superfamily|nr:DUF1016 N-terminal domain-containing protein [Pirellula sp.]
MANEMIPGDYLAWLESVKSRIQSARSRAALAVNAELIELYHSIGSDILERQTRHGWGSKVIARAAADLKAAFPDMKWFSTRNLHYMRLFAEQCPDMRFVQQPAAQVEQETHVPQFGQQAAAQLPCFHIVTLLTQAEPTEREWYAVHAIAGGWSRQTLQKKHGSEPRSTSALSASLRFVLPSAAKREQAIKANLKGLVYGG